MNLNVEESTEENQNSKEKTRPAKKHPLSPYTTLIIGFFCLIVVGALLLLLPVSHQPGVSVAPVDALFTATSAVCVTGLITVDTGTTYSIFGRCVILLLIQCGGLGVATVGVFAIMMMGRRVGLRERILLKEALNQHSIKGVVGLLWWIVGITAAIEGLGAVLSFLVFSQDYPLWDAVGISIFHAISGFNNAGFDILGGFQSLTHYQDNQMLILTTSALIILGGLGFVVIQELISFRKKRRMSLHSKIVVFMTCLLLLVGTLLLKLTDQMTWLSAFFQSVTVRTAGFNSVEVSQISNGGLLVMMVLMVIGASPGSTGGGIKTTTAFTLLVGTFKMARQERCIAFNRQIPWDLLNKAYVFFMLVSLLLLMDTFLICLLQPEFSVTAVLYEVISAFGTVGITMGITPSLCMGSKLIIITTMFFGRLGLLTLAYAWTPKQASNLECVEERYIVG